MIDGAVAFKVALTSLDVFALLRRAEGYLISHRRELEDVISTDFSIEQDEDLEYVLASTTHLPVETDYSDRSDSEEDGFDRLVGALGAALRDIFRDGTTSTYDVGDW